MSRKPQIRVVADAHTLVTSNTPVASASARHGAVRSQDRQTRLVREDPPKVGSSTAGLAIALAGMQRVASVI
jgi:hypothetical protein